MHELCFSLLEGNKWKKGKKSIKREKLPFIWRLYARDLLSGRRQQHVTTEGGMFLGKISYNIAVRFSAYFPHMFKKCSTRLQNEFRVHWMTPAASTHGLTQHDFVGLQRDTANQLKTPCWQIYLQSWKVIEVDGLLTECVTTRRDESTHNIKMFFLVSLCERWRTSNIWNLLKPMEAIFQCFRLKLRISNVKKELSNVQRDASVWQKQLQNTHLIYVFSKGSSKN